MQNKILLIILLLVSGTLSGFSAQFIIIPGLIFGIFVGIWFYTAEKISLAKTFLWIPLSALAYYIAVTIYFRGGSVSEVLHFIEAGLVGAAILALATSLLITKLKLIQIIFIILIGGILSLAFSEFSSLITAFIIWQLGVGVALTTWVHRNKKLTLSRS